MTSNYAKKLLTILFSILFYIDYTKRISLADHYVLHHQTISTSTMNPISSLECRQQQSNCTDNVYPYLNDPQYMFPTSLDHVDDMCKMWSRFVDCIRRYISHCFEENRRQLFHKSVENSIDTVHAICSSKLYQTEYLKKANCFKQVSMDHCGLTYQLLVDNIANPMAKDEHICCSYAQFRRCVNRPLLEECGRKAKNLMDHSMSFLISRCEHYSYQRQNECPQPIPLSKSIDEWPKISHRIKEADLHPSSNSLDFTSNTDVVSPVHSESREWPSSATPFETLGSNAQKHERHLEENLSINDKRELVHHQSFPKESTTKYNDSDHENGPEMIIYTIKPQSEVSFVDPPHKLMASSSQRLFQFLNLMFICSFSILLS